MGCTNEASSDCGAPEGTEYTRSVDLPTYQPKLVHSSPYQPYSLFTVGIRMVL